MGELVDFKRAKDEKEHQRKETRIKALKNSFKKSRESAESKSGGAAKLKNLFRKKNLKKSPRKRK